MNVTFKKESCEPLEDVIIFRRKRNRCSRQRPTVGTERSGHMTHDDILFVVIERRRILERIGKVAQVG